MSSEFYVLTTRELVERYIAQRNWPDSPGSASAKTHCQLMLQFFGNDTVGELCERQRLRTLCREYIAANTDLANATIHKRLGYLRSALRWAWHERRIDGLPAMEFPSRDAKRDRTLTQKERDAILLAADSNPTPAHLRAYVHLALGTNQYSHAILNLTWDQVNFHEGTISFPAQGNNKATVVQMDNRLKRVLELAEDHKADNCNYVIQYRAHKVASIYVGLSALLERAGVDNILVADFRRSKAETAENNNPPDTTLQGDSPAPLFISYSSRDGEEHANALLAELERSGHPCWIAHRELKAGVFAGQLTRAIKGARALIVVVTPTANESADVLQEVVKAHNAKKTILPIIVGNTTPGEDLEYYLNAVQNITWNEATRVAKAVISKLKKL